MNEHPYGWLSLLPPLVAIVLSILTRRVVVSLLAGVFIGALILCQWNPLLATVEMVRDHLLTKILESDTLHVFAFTILMGMMVGVVNRAAGMRGLVNVISKFASTRQRGQFVTWLLGLVIFFDDYANTLLLGHTLRPLADRLKISREKLAYLVDSTAAPVAGLALISTWVGGEIGFVQDGIDALPASFDGNAYQMFVASIPYRFYILWALLFVPMVALLDRDFGPMLKAERRSIQDEPPANTTASDTSVSNEIDESSDRSLQSDPTNPPPETVARWYNAVIPIGVTVVALLFFLYRTGYQSESDSLMKIFGNADSYSSLLWGALTGLVTAFLLIVPQRIVPNVQLLRAAGRGAMLMAPALMILWLAQTMSTMTRGELNLSTDSVVAAAEVVEPSDAISTVQPSLFPDQRHRLYTGVYLSNQLQDLRSRGGFFDDFFVPLLPTMVFVLASIVAFSTGTSWGTMGIVMPLVIPLAYSQIMLDSQEGLGTAAHAGHPILLAAIASVLAGAIFGDHCSPISDTTVLSSQASGCDHTAHVRTQLPYAVVVGIVAIMFGTLPVGWGVSVWLLLPAGTIVMLVFLLMFGKRCSDSE